MPDSSSVDNDAVSRNAQSLGDVPPKELRAELHRMADWVADYRETIESRIISPDVVPGEIAAQLKVDWENPAPIADLLNDIDRIVMPGIVHWGHPAFLGYFGSTSNGPALLGEIAAAALNVSAMTWRTSPAATEMESVVLRWIQDLVGIPGDFMGVVYDTASVAIVHALAAARERSSPDIRKSGLAGRPDLSPFRLYASEEAHSSVAKAAILLGLGEANVVRVKTDSEFRMDVAALSRVIAADKLAGYQPLAVIATIGTTSTASVDPVAAIATICRQHGIWLHVDAAYGGALGALPEGRWAMDGIEQADSIVINPHKWLFVPLDFSVLYIRDPETLRSVFSLVPEYLRGDASSSGGPDYMDYGIQLGRRFRALKAWMVFRAFGRTGIVERIREHCRLARLLESWIGLDDEFALAAPVQMGVVCFRYRPEDEETERADLINQRAVERVNARGRAYLTHTVLRGRVAMRIGIGNLLTTEDHLATAWSEIRLAVHELGGGGDGDPN